MKANYHTHTSRCGHARGADEDYVLAAIERGFSELGFSDHVPWPYKSGFTNPGTRMSITQLDEYLSSVRSLKEKYADQISILTGFECEHFPEYMGWLADMKQEKQIDYLILGNHYDGSDETGRYFGNSKTAKELGEYVESTIKGMETGLFAYLAHPDMFMRGYGKFDENCRAAARDLCQACMALGIPMEYNVHDRYSAPHRKSYPEPEFFDIVIAQGAQVIIGLDAHEPQEIGNPAQWDRAVSEIEGYGVKRLEKL